MKRTILLLTLLSAVTSSAIAECDTTIVFNDKMVYIQDSIDQVKVKVSAINTSGNVTEFKPVFEGLYSDGKSYEKWTVVEELGIQIPLLTSQKVKKRQPKNMRPHWAGFGYGLSTFTDGSKFNHAGGIPIDRGQSNEWTWNFIEHITPIYSNILGITTGVGLSFRNYHLDENTYLYEVQNVVDVYQGYTNEHFKYSKLHTAHLTLPVLLEFQPFQYGHHKPYIAAGVVGGIKLSSYYKYKYVDAEGLTHKDKQKGMNLPPITMDYMAKAGIGSWSVYAKYSPFSIFEDGEGPDVQHASIGLMLDF